MRPSRICCTYPPGALPELPDVLHSVCRGQSASGPGVNKTLRPSSGPRTTSLQDLSRRDSLLPFHFCIPGRYSFCFHLLLLAAAFLMSGAAVFASASVSNPSTAENL